MSEFIEAEPEVKQRNKVKSKAVNKAVYSHSREHQALSSTIAVDVNLDYEDNNLALQQDRVNHKFNAASLGPGTILKTSREAAKLSKEDVAKELRLSTRYIDYLEQDAYYKFTAVAFYIGYVRNYAKLLDLDSDKLIAKFNAVYKVTPETVKVKKAAAVNNSNATAGLLDILQPNLTSFVSNFAKKVFKNYNHKYMIAAISLVVFFLFLSWFVSAINNSLSNKQMSVVTSLPPERVDELLPTGPVIVKNTEEQLIQQDLDKEIELIAKTEDNLKNTDNLNNLNKLNNQVEQYS